MALRLTEKQFQNLKAGKAIGRTSKFLNRKEKVDGQVFASGFEASYYRELRLRAKAGDVRNIRVQVVYPLVVNEQLVCSYRADFVIEERGPDVKTLFGTQPTWAAVIIDTKSPPTRRCSDYRIKKKLMAALGWRIVEVVSPTRPRKRRKRGEKWRKG